MNAYQKSVSMAMLLVFGALAVKHSWLKRFGAWASSPVRSASADAAEGKADTGPQVLLADWQAGLVLYLFLMLIGDTEVAPVAPPIAWAVAFVNAVAASGVLEQNYPGLFGGATQPQGSQGTGSGPGAAQGGNAY